MAFDPYSGEVHRAPAGEVAEGHYANMADRIDGIFAESPIDPVELHRQAYARAAEELNCLPASERTPALRARVEELGREAAEAASEANLELLMERGV